MGNGRAVSRDDRGRIGRSIAQNETPRRCLIHRIAVVPGWRPRDPGETADEALAKLPMLVGNANRRPAWILGGSFRRPPHPLMVLAYRARAHSVALTPILGGPSFGRLAMGRTLATPLASLGTSAASTETASASSAALALSGTASAQTDWDTDMDTVPSAQSAKPDRQGVSRPQPKADHTT